MTNTTNFNFLIPDGSDNVNLLTQNYPNWTNLDAILKGIKDTGVTTATATKTGTNFAVVRNDTDCNFFRFVATANYVAGDTFTVDGVPVTATSAAGTALPSGAFVINQSVIAIVNSGVLTVLVGGGLSSVDASDVDYDNSVSGLTAADVQAAIDEVQAEIAAIPSTVAASAVTYDNTVSGLTASDVQAAIDELKALIPASRQYVSTGLETLNSRCNILDGGYYIDNDTGIVYVDITIYTTASVSTGGFMIKGFPTASATNGTSPHNITPVYNKLFMIHASAPDPTQIGAGASISAGETIHYTASYAKA